MIVIKVNVVPNSRTELLERVHRAWRINPGRLFNQERLIAVYKGEILEEYEVKGYAPDKIDPKRVAFDLDIIAGSNLKGKKIDYKTSNPCTIIDVNELVIV